MLFKLYTFRTELSFTFNTFDVAFSTRLSSLSFNIIDENISGNIDISDRIKALTLTSHVFIEPGLTLRAGWKYLKIQFQASSSGCLNRSNLYIGEEYHFC